MCPQGEYASSSVACSKAPAGTQVFLPQLAPEKCPTGTYSEQISSAGAGVLQRCVDCPKGKICRDVTTIANQTNCPAGFFCNSESEFSAAYSVQPCPKGYQLKANPG